MEAAVCGMVAAQEGDVLIPQGMGIKKFAVRWLPRIV